MFKLYGFSVSNYYNMVKLALLEKGLPFEEVPFYAGTTPRRWPSVRGARCRCSRTDQGFINETSVILEYIEQSQTRHAIAAGDPFERAQVLAMAKEIELYIELPGRACYGEAFFGVALPDAIKEKTKAELLLGIASLGDTANSALMWRATV
jgi:glutathione S-transferase